jgi:hypothetical protein
VPGLRPALAAVKSEPAVSGKIGPGDRAVGAPLVVKRQTPANVPSRPATHVLDSGTRNMGRTSCSTRQAAPDCAANFVAPPHDDVAGPRLEFRRFKTAPFESKVAGAIQYHDFRWMEEVVANRRNWPHPAVIDDTALLGTLPGESPRQENPDVGSSVKAPSGHLVSHALNDGPRRRRRVSQWLCSRFRQRRTGQRIGVLRRC